MGSNRKVGDDILKEWLDFREEELGSLTCKEDKEHFIYFEEISEDILNNVSDNNIEYVKSQLEKLDDNIMEYMHYCFEKYYRNGFCDAVELISGCLR